VAPEARRRGARLCIGQFQPGNPPSLGNVQRFWLARVPGFTDFFALAATLAD